jgi:hypothetical protein
MTSSQNSRALIYFVSPYGLAMVSYLFFLLSCLIPPSTYSAYMREPDFMFLDPATILFYTLCVASFVAGAWLIDWLSPSVLVDYRLKTRISPMLFLLAPLTLGVAGTVISTILLIRQIPNLFILLFSQRGSEIKEIMALQVEGRFALAPLLLTAVIWWASWRRPQLEMTRWQKKLTSLYLFAATLAVIASSVITVSRNLLMPTVAGLGILYMIRKAVQGTVSNTAFLRGAIVTGLSVCLLFFGLSFLRGTSDWDELIHALVGYTAASYNRLAAVVNDQLHFPYAGEGLYLSSVVTHTRLLPVSYILTPPDDLSMWGSEFGAVSEANLDSDLIWPGAFGQVFSDLRWYSLLFIFGYGVLYGMVWHSFRRGQIFGIILYPWCGFCVLFWCGTNYLLDSPIEPIILAAFILMAYEHICISARKPATGLTWTPPTLR